MTDTSNDTAARQMSDEDRMLRLNIALALWLIDNHETAPKEAAARREAFQAEKTEYGKKASAFFQMLKHRGVELTLTEEAKGKLSGGAIDL